MPIKTTSNDKGMWITWETPDEGISTTFRIKKTDTDAEVLGKLFRLTRFIASQMDEMATEIAELEMEIVGTSASTVVAPASMTTSTAAAGDPANALRVPMMPPASLSDQPAGGAPVSTFGWSDMPTTSVPEPLAGQWEMIPPGEM